MNNPVKRTLSSGNSDQAEKKLCGTKPLKVSVMNLVGRIINYPAQPDDTVQKLKAQIQTSEVIDLNEQRLTFDGRELGNHLSLEECNIKEGTIVRLDLNDGYVINVRKSCGRVFQVVVKPGEKVKDVKVKIFKIDDTMPIERQRLFYAGNELEDENVISGYGVMTASVVDVTLTESKKFWEYLFS